MPKYLLAYRGGRTAETPEEQEKVMQDWMHWFEVLGEAVVDPGTPFSHSSTISEGGRVTSGGDAHLSGYSIVAADDMAHACDISSRCPVLHAGGTVEVYETLPMG
jgi:hypothetical protein